MTTRQLSLADTAAVPAAEAGLVPIAGTTGPSPRSWRLPPRQLPPRSE